VPRHLAVFAFLGSRTASPERPGPPVISAPRVEHTGRIGIDAAGGRTFIQQVFVEVDNGQHQVIRNLNATLAGHQSVTLDLDGNRRSIRRIVVYGRDLNSGWRRTPGGFNMTAV
jgi:hypothetical protein